MNSLLQDKEECFFCKTTYNLEMHHIFFGTANRKLSEEDGMKVYLCAFHHRNSPNGVHFNKELDLYLKKQAEKKWCLFYGLTIKDFIKRYGRNYI